jgi:hypothetical protein
MLSIRYHSAPFLIAINSRFWLPDDRSISGYFHLTCKSEPNRESVFDYNNDAERDLIVSRI